MFKEFIGSIKSVGRYIAQNPIKSAAIGAVAITGGLAAGGALPGLAAQGAKVLGKNTPNITQAAVKIGSKMGVTFADMFGMPSFS